MKKIDPVVQGGYIKQPVNSSCMQGMGLRFPLRISSATQILSNTQSELQLDQYARRIFFKMPAMRALRRAETAWHTVGYPQY